MSLRILFNCKDYAVCEKPVGISCESPGLPDLYKEIYKTSCYPVHRLDVGTGGACVLALSKESCRVLQSLWSDKHCQKEYLAVVSGKPPAASGIYMDYLYHDPRQNKTFIVKKQRKGIREAVCSWECLESAQMNEQILSLVRVRLETGRTHQIRVQFASRGFPLVGDRKYGSRIKADSVSLWSSRISFPDPFHSGRITEAVSFPPAVFPWHIFDTVRKL